MKTILDSNNTETEPFEFVGDCYISAVGSGQITILREMGGEYIPMTTDRGELLTFIGDDVLFNGSISCKKRIKHKVEASTTSEIVIDIVRERG